MNAIAKRRGSLFRDRHHRRELSSPTQMRNALVHVLFNDRKHDFEGGGPISEETMQSLDDRTSIGWITLWSERARPPPEALARLRARNIDRELDEAPVTEPRTWLARSGCTLVHAAVRSCRNGVASGAGFHGLCPHQRRRSRLGERA